MWLLDIIHSLGGYLIEDDIRDFPFTDVASDTHPGIVHHGAMGLAIQTFAYIAALADVGAEMEKELQDKDEMQLILEDLEVVAYPVPSL